MKTRPFPFSRLALAAAGLLAAAGCSIVPEAKTDPMRFYVLATAAAGATPVASAPAVQLREVELASYLRSRPMVVRRGANELEFRDFARWGEPLEAGIARVLREELLARGAASAVLTAGSRREATKIDATLTVRVLACEGEAGGAVAFRAVWELAPAAPESKVPAARGDFHAPDLRWDGKSEAALAAQLSQAVSALAAQIAGELGKK
ncbi:MAG: ABC-type transport auxiliary lipoprotein family protein [Opitutaceae bacterium]|nr:ABC-type transport auxiliary lipoprotein family protein [Opitutaceae bacterium]